MCVSFLNFERLYFANIFSGSVFTLLHSCRRVIHSKKVLNLAEGQFISFPFVNCTFIYLSCNSFFCVIFKGLGVLCLFKVMFNTELIFVEDVKLRYWIIF